MAQQGLDRSAARQGCGPRSPRRPSGNPKIWSKGTATTPNQLWVADFTYVATWSGTVYLAFVLDVFSRRIVGWRAATTMTTELVLDTPEIAIWSPGRDGIEDLSGLAHHTDAGGQYTSLAFTQRLIDEGVDPSVGTVGDAYDNALAESHIGAYKTELIRPEAPGATSSTSSWNPDVGRLVHPRAAPRVHRRPHTDRGRASPLPCTKPSRPDRVETQPEASGKLRGGSA